MLNSVSGFKQKVAENGDGEKICNTLLRIQAIFGGNCLCPALYSWPKILRIFRRGLFSFHRNFAGISGFFG